MCSSSYNFHIIIFFTSGMGRSRLCGSSCRKWVSISWLNCFFVFFCEIANNFQFSGPFLSPPMLSLRQTKHGGSALRWVDYLTVINDFFGANCWSFNLQLCGYFLEVHIVRETGLVTTNKPRIHCTTKFSTLIPALAHWSAFHRTLSWPMLNAPWRTQKQNSRHRATELITKRCRVLQREWTLLETWRSENSDI